MRKSGFTLVEVMIGVLLSTVVLGGGYKVWSASQRSFAKANTRQTLQTEVRRVIDQLTVDFKSIKAGTLEVNGSLDGCSGVIKFNRFVANEDDSKIDSQSLIEITYDFERPKLFRTETGKGKRLLSSNIIHMDIARGAEPGALMPNGMEQTAMSRMDISLVGAQKIPGTVEIASHTEKTSVVMRNEFVAAAPVQNYVSLADLTTATDSPIKESTNDSVFSSSLTAEALRDMPSEQLAYLMTRETESKEEAEKQIKEANDHLSDIDAKQDRSWRNLFGVLGRGTEVSQIQTDLRTHSGLKDVQNDVEKLQNIIQKDEEKFLRRSLGSENAALPDDEEQLDALKKAYDLKVKDRALRMVYEKNPEKDEDGNKIPYTGLMASFDSDKIKQGIQYDSKGNEVSFSETSEEFAKRSKETESIRQAAERLDLTWMDSSEAEAEVKQYTAAKDLIDLANVKMAYIQSRDLAQSNIDLIKAEQNRPDRKN